MLNADEFITKFCEEHPTSRKELENYNLKPYPINVLIDDEMYTEDEITDGWKLLCRSNSRQLSYEYEEIRILYNKYYPEDIIITEVEPNGIKT